MSLPGPLHPRPSHRLAFARRMRGSAGAEMRLRHYEWQAAKGGDLVHELVYTLSQILHLVDDYPSSLPDVLTTLDEALQIFREIFPVASWQAQQQAEQLLPSVYRRGDEPRIVCVPRVTDTEWINSFTRFSMPTDTETMTPVTDTEWINSFRAFCPPTDAEIELKERGDLFNRPSASCHAAVVGAGAMREIFSITGPPPTDTDTDLDRFLSSGLMPAN